ncbi:glycoside hydrolase family 18 protein [Dyadobacter sp. LHD-138]|uniref:glycoside hydrolase family 18 protein n=1 Tax=Dyadobacter sp. LHD-138 TaxID=3071413 RepID=UPI0027E1E299|nr:glycoside hydrolase family 18 protein [Dyadobacter sp. LHD-138]MDQ6476821.1 glycoside hydrolase family 18 protein [Dyadobacter sp. LHD-138]
MTSLFQRSKIQKAAFSLLAGVALGASVMSCGGKESEKSAVTEAKPVIIGYVGGFHGLVNTDEIAANKLTHINYAFVNVQDGKAFLTNEKTDSTNFRKLNLLKKINPDLKILISIGGWAWSENFSDAVLTDSSRLEFAKSSVDIIRKYKLDGVDIDWEYPAMPGEEGNVYRPEDKENFTLMFEAIRKELDVLEKEDGQKKLLTTAVAGWEEFIPHSEMGKAQQYLDFVNLMTYDLFSGDTTVHHAGLYATDKFKTRKSADNGVKAYMNAGVPAGKIVLGIPFYGRSFTLGKDSKTILGQMSVAKAYIDGYGYIKDSLVNKKGYKEYRDEVAKAPYLYNEKTRVFIGYDDEKSVNEKCKYVLANKLGGVMFWEYNSDPKGYLLDEINKSLK